MSTGRYFRPEDRVSPDGASTPFARRAFGIDEFSHALEGVLDQREVRSAAGPATSPWQTEPGAFSAIGRLLTDPDHAYALLEERLLPAGFTPQLREQAGEYLVVAVRSGGAPAPPSPRRALWFFAATLVSVLITGGLYGESPSLERLIAGPDGPGGWLGMLAAAGELLVGGIPYAASILGILVAHEAGHFFAARRVGIPSGFPYLIPLPFPLSPFGTLGAVMRINAPPRDRHALLAMAAAGPLAGLAVAMPLMVAGLATSHVERIGAVGLQEGNSLLYWLLKYLIFGQSLPSATHDVILNSVAWAGWAGLFVTAINLLPIGQLDGGHIAYALLGQRARWLGWAVTAGVAVLALFSQAWIVMFVLLVVFGRVYAVPLNDASRLRPAEVAVGIVMLILFALLFVPDPLRFRGI